MSTPNKPKRSAIKIDLFASQTHISKLDKLGDPLTDIDQLIDIKALSDAVEQSRPDVDYSRGGRPPYPVETMLRILLIKRLYGLSDEQCEYQLLDRSSHKRFCKLEDSLSVPDRTTIWNFQQTLGEDGVTALFNAIDAQIQQAGYIARCGQLIDATLIKAPIQRNRKKDNESIKQGDIPEDWSEPKRRQKDVEATWTKKHGNSHFGYKLSINVDNKHKLIRTYETDTAKVHDSQHIEVLFDHSNTNKDFYADSGYAGEPIRAKLKSHKLRNHIQNKGVRNKPLSACQKRRNKRIAKTRVRVEHPFAQIHHMGGKMIKTIGQARANVQMGLIVCCHNLKRLTYLKKHGVVAF